MEVKNIKSIINDLSELKKAYPNLPNHLFPELYHEILSFEIHNSCQDLLMLSDVYLLMKSRLSTLMYMKLRLMINIINDVIINRITKYQFFKI
jgi:hypothetical protein